MYILFLFVEFQLVKLSKVRVRGFEEDKMDTKERSHCTVEVPRETRSPQRPPKTQENLQVCQGAEFERRGFQLGKESGSDNVLLLGKNICKAIIYIVSLKSSQKH